MVQQMGERFVVASEVGTQQFERHLGRCCMNFSDAALVMVCPTIGKVVPIDHRNDGVPKPHGGNGLRQVCRLFGVKGGRSLDGADGTKAAAPRAFLPGDHEGGVPACPAFVDVWATSLFANGVKLVVFDG